MTKKKAPAQPTVAAVADDDAGEAVSSPLAEIEADIEESMALDLQAALAECGDTGQVSIQLYKMSPKEEAGACTTYSSAELSIDRVRDEWGAGIYRLYFRDPRGRILTRKQLSVVAKVKTAQPDIAKLIAEAQAGNKGSGDMSMVMMKVLEMQSAQMVALLSKPAPAPPPAPPPMGLTEIVAVMSGLASIMKPATPPTSEAELLLKGMKVFKDMNEDKDDSSIVSVVGKGLEMASAMMTRGGEPTAPAPRPVQATVVRAPAAPAIETPIAAEPTPEEAAEALQMSKVAWLREQVRRLVEKARKNRDPELYADLMLDELPDFIGIEDIQAGLLSSTWFEQLSFLNSEVANLREWFTELRECVAERIAERMAEAQQQTPPQAVVSTDADDVVTAEANSSS